MNVHFCNRSWFLRNASQRKSLLLSVVGLLVTMLAGMAGPLPAFAIALNTTGKGADGPLLVSGLTLVDSVKSSVNAAVSAGSSFVPLSSTAGFSPGDEVMVFTPQGTSGNAGSYSFYNVTSVSASGLTIGGGLQNSLDPTLDRNFVQRVPNYSNVTVQPGGVLTASAWDGSTGGVVAFRVFDELDVQTGGAILADGLGFRGGAAVNNPVNGAPIAGFQGESFNGLGAQGVNVGGVAMNNFGGGGSGLPDSTAGDVGGGGGGGSYGDSLLGTSAPSVFGTTVTLEGGIAGTAYGVSDLSQIYFGSGGGGAGTDSDGGNSTGGAGGNGGGIIFIAAGTLNLNGTLSSAGADGEDGIGVQNADETGGGGGGSGGSIYLALLEPLPYLSLDPVLNTTGGLGGADITTSFALHGGLGGVGRIFVTQATAVPEPSAGLLTLCGLIFLRCRRRRFSKGELLLES